MNQPVIEVRDLLVSRGDRFVLNIPCLTFHEGRIVSLIGPNGAGKTTLLLSLLRLVKPDSGDILYRGRSILHGLSIRQYRRRLTLVFQEPLLFSTSVYRNIASGPGIRGMRRHEIRSTVEEMAELFGITHILNRRASSLSGGEAQRVNLARSLAVRPEILLMDEPFSSLDAPTRESLISDLERIIRGKGITVVFATHDRSEAMRLADEIIVMNRGAVMQSGTPAEITHTPVDEFVASFVGTETILTGKVIDSDGGTFSVSVNGLTVNIAGSVEPGMNITFCIHPENIVLSSSLPDTSARNSFRCTVVKTVPLGYVRKVYLECGFTLVAYATGGSVDVLDMVKGRELVASFKPTGVHVIRKWPGAQPATRPQN
jgi:tungstate transport system ATP-binding protein